MRQPIEHWVKEWKDKRKEENPPDRKKVTSCTRCDTGTAYFRAGPSDYLCENCVARWYPNKTKADLGLLFDAQEVELVRVEAHEKYKRQKKCARCGNAVERRTGRGLYCGNCFDFAVQTKAEK